MSEVGEEATEKVEGVWGWLRWPGGGGRGAGDATKHAGVAGEGQVEGGSEGEPVLMTSG